MHVDVAAGLAVGTTESAKSHGEVVVWRGDTACHVLQDCPNHAVYVDVAAALDSGTTGAVPSSLCIFEDDLSETAWRHRSTGALLPRKHRRRLSFLSIMISHQLQVKRRLV